MTINLPRCKFSSQPSHLVCKLTAKNPMLNHKFSLIVQRAWHLCNQKKIPLYQTHLRNFLVQLSHFRLTLSPSLDVSRNHNFFMKSGQQCLNCILLLKSSLWEVSSNEMATTSFYPLSTKEELVKQFVGKSIKDVATPAAVLDLSKLRVNCNRMLEACESTSFGWRAHIKTHKVDIYICYCLLITPC